MLLHRIRSLILVLVLMLLIFPVSHVSAGWVSCRSDPVVTLSNGLILDLSADIETSPWNVEQVDYILHVPPGVSLVTSITTPTWLTTIESFTLYDDAPPGEYHSETIVYTSEGDVPVVAHTILVEAAGIHLDSVSIPGMEQEILYGYLQLP